MWCTLWRVSLRTLRRSWLDILVSVCMHLLSTIGIVHQGGRSVAKSGPMDSETGGVMGFSVYMTQYVGL